MYTHDHSSVFHNAANVDVTQVSTDVLMSKQILHIYIYMYNGILLSLKRREILTYITTWMNFEDMLTEIIQSQRQISCDSFYMSYLE